MRWGFQCLARLEDSVDLVSPHKNQQLVLDGLEDICRLRSEELRDGRLVFTADTTKNCLGREAVLPDDLYAALDAYKGETYLWERSPPELIATNKAKGYPTHRQNPEFSPQRLSNWIVQIMQDYQKQNTAGEPRATGPLSLCPRDRLPSYESFRRG